MSDVPGGATFTDALIPARFRAILRAPMRRLLAVLTALPLVLAAACGSPCEDLGDRICRCQPSGASRDACNNAIQDQIGSGNPKPGSSQQDFCEAKLKTCPNPSNDDLACDRMRTEDGKIACGLAYPVAAPQ